MGVGNVLITITRTSKSFSFPKCHRIGIPSSTRASKFECSNIPRNVATFFAEPNIHTVRVAGMFPLVNQ